MFKKVVDIENGIAYKIPTRLIIEEGLRQEDLKNYPTWSKINDIAASERNQKDFKRYS